MYCRNCGNEVAEQAELCLNCGAKPLKGTKYCWHCKTETSEMQEMCIKCGVSLSKQAQKGEGKDWLVALLLAIFLGTLGVHRFYTGHIATGILMILTAGGCGIWWLIDVIIIATGNFKDGEGRPLVKDI